MSFTLRLVLLGREVSYSSFLQATWMARYVGTQVNKDTTSNDTRVSSFDTAWDLINSTKAWEFLTWELVNPTSGESRPARNLDSSYVGEHTKDTMGRSGHLVCELGQPIQ